MAFASATVLLVEDDGDIRELMSTLLDLAGLTVTSCSTAESALEQLREQHFDLVLTDYMLPHRSGGWLLRQASQEGLIEGVPVMVVTAHPGPPDVHGFEIVPKPFDLDDLVSRVQRRLGTIGRTPKLPLSAAPGASRAGGGEGGEGGECPDPVELILYVSAHSPKTVAAMENIKHAIARFAPNRVRLTICDLSKQPLDGTSASIAFTPTLVKRAPGPRTFILAHLTNPGVVTELIESCAEEELV